jgi:catechol 2,3-dioxygenase-like lactoylglutathione lyase family enzyme
VKTSYTHTNIVARDWKALARFYIDVFGCAARPPERDLSGDWLDRLTSIPGVRIRGTHLTLPGFGPDGPTIEIFEYNPNEAGGPEPASATPTAAMPADARAINAPGFGHIAFSVDDVDACLAKLLALGGSTVGETVRGAVDGVGTIHLVYARDPEGNIIEIQKWEK